MPVTWKEKPDPRKPPPDNPSDPPQQAVRRRFVFKPHWFVLAQTDGPDVPRSPIPEWSAERALAALDVAEVPFELMDGNVQGYARHRSIAVSPIAYHPHRTRFHELAHVLLGHTADAAVSDGDERQPRELREVEAEAVAYLCLCCLGLDGQAFSRGYLQHWLRSAPRLADEKPIPERSVHRIFRVADEILRSGRPPASPQEKNAPSQFPPSAPV